MINETFFFFFRKWKWNFELNVNFMDDLNKKYEISCEENKDFKKQNNKMSLKMKC